MLQVSFLALEVEKKYTIFFNHSFTNTVVPRQFDKYWTKVVPDYQKRRIIKNGFLPCI